MIRVNAGFHAHNYRFLLQVTPFRRWQYPLFSLHIVFEMARATGRQTLLRHNMANTRRVGIVLTPSGTRVQGNVSG